MRNLAYLLAVAVLMWTACTTEQSAPSAHKNEAAASASREKLQYQEKAEAQLRELDREIADLKEKAATQGQEARKELDQTLTELEAQARGASSETREIQE